MISDLRARGPVNYLTLGVAIGELSKLVDACA